jgi:hypothetical protein
VELRDGGCRSESASRPRRSDDSLRRIRGDGVVEVGTLRKRTAFNTARGTDVRGTIPNTGHFPDAPRWEPAMPYTRPVRRFYLTPPRVITFVMTVVLAVIAVVAVYGHLALLRGLSGFVILLVAYLVLAVGVLFCGL